LRTIVGTLRGLGIDTAPFLTRVLGYSPRTFRVLSKLESYLAGIQGKGSGASWDLKGEASVAASHINRSDAVVFDAGAHRGEWSVLLLAALGSTRCRIFLFEPSRHSQEVLRSLDLPHATLITAAVGDKPGVATLYNPGGDASEVASLYPRRETFLKSESFVEEMVKVVTIDEVMAEYRIDVLDFLKLDLEGHELAALRGASESLETRRIKALAFEFGCSNLNSRTYFYDFWDFLRPYGYRIERICPGGVLIPIEEYKEELEYFKYASNYLASLE
jgi:FkbM family methyltransferase